MSKPTIPPTPGNDLKEWARRLVDYLTVQRAQSETARPVAPQLKHRLGSGESAARDGVMMWGVSEDAPVSSKDGAFVRVLLAGDDVVITNQTPASASATGTAGTIAYDASYIYICTATDTWKRVAISSW